MRVFLTGASGFIGSVVAQELLAAGHQVLGLARSDASASALTQAGVDVHRGDLSDTDSLVAGAQACDGVIHCGFIHDFSDYAGSCATDRRVIEALGTALEGTGRPLVVTSGTALVGPGRLITEADTAYTGPGAIPRAASETVAQAFASRGVRVSLVRLPPSVHGEGDQAFIPALIGIARATGVSAYIGDGLNRWPAVHRLDTAPLFRLALEKAAAGVALHGVAEEGIPMRAIAETIGAGLGIPVRSLAHDEAAAHFTWLTGFVGVDNPTSNNVTCETMGWTPKEIGLLADIQENGYFS